MGRPLPGCPEGTNDNSPALKRRAILKMSLRDEESGERFFRQENNPIHRRCFQGHFAVTVCQEDVGHTQHREGGRRARTITWFVVSREFGQRRSSNMKTGFQKSANNLFPRPNV